MVRGIRQSRLVLRGLCDVACCWSRPRRLSVRDSRQHNPEVERTLHDLRVVS
jgi:hypothetical protein